MSACLGFRCFGVCLAGFCVRYWFSNVFGVCLVVFVVVRCFSLFSCLFSFFFVVAYWFAHAFGICLTCFVVAWWVFVVLAFVWPVFVCCLLVC